MSEEANPEPPQSIVGTVRNIAEPVHLAELLIGGFSAGAAQAGETVPVFIALGITSDQPVFHHMVPQLSKVLEAAAQKEQKHLSLQTANSALVVIHGDNSADVWVDTVAISLRMSVKRNVAAGTAIFENDVLDVNGLWYPAVTFQPTDRVICLIREGFRFALYFDFNPAGALDIERAQRELGALYRQLKYRELYDFVSNSTEFETVIRKGWFPFIEIISNEFNALARHHAAGFPLEEEEHKLIMAFTGDRLDAMFSRWMLAPHLKSREAILKEGLDAFKNNKPIAALKILLSEIEGMLSDAYFAATGTRTRKLAKLIEFCEAAGTQRAGSNDTLFLPAAFSKYLQNYTYADFSYETDDRSAGSRHAVGHGAAAVESYTQTRALQALLTLDQLGFFLRS